MPIFLIEFILGLVTQGIFNSAKIVEYVHLAGKVVSPSTAGKVWEEFVKIADALHAHAHSNGGAPPPEWGKVVLSPSDAASASHAAPTAGEIPAPTSEG